MTFFTPTGPFFWLFPSNVLAFWLVLGCAWLVSRVAVWLCTWLLVLAGWPARTNYDHI